MNVVSRRAADGSVHRSYYFRPPKGKALPEGVSARLPNNPTRAAAAARRLAGLCVDVRVGARGHHYTGRLEELAVDALAMCRKRAVRRRWDCLLTPDQVVALLRRQDYRCAVSGLEFRTAPASEVGTYRAPYRPSIDRIDCSKGYVLGNVRIVLVAVNVALGDWGEAVLVDIAKGIAGRNRKGAGK